MIKMFHDGLIRRTEQSRAGLRQTEMIRERQEVPGFFLISLYRKLKPFHILDCKNIKTTFLLNFVSSESGKNPGSAPIL